MEIEAAFEKWNGLAGHLEELYYKLSRKEKELEEISQSIQKEVSGENLDLVKRSLRKKEELLHGQVVCLWDMKIALEKVKRLYEGCEEGIIDEGEGIIVDRAPDFCVRDLTAWNVIPIQFK